MDTEKFKYIVNEVRPGDVCDIRFFGAVDEWSSRDFVYEFLWLEKQNPCKIRVLINSEGGSVISGMNMYSVINGSSVPTECINEGLAASIASVIWIAGNKSVMRDYSLLMIHNPFVKNKTEGDSEVNDLLTAFKGQLETIYCKRFGFSKKKVREIMDGAEGSDGTFITADEAVGMGILPADNVIKTTKQKAERVQNAIKDITDGSKIQEAIASIYNEISLDEVKNDVNKHQGDTEPNLNKITENNLNNQPMDNNTVGFEFGAVTASLGFKERVDAAQVMNRITELIGVENQLAEANNVINTLKTEKAGEAAKVQNLTEELQNVQNQLNVYKAAEEAAQKSKITAMVQDAIDAGKINAETKANWEEMALSNFELTQNTLASIPGRDKISTQINNDASHVTEVQNGMTAGEKDIQAKINAAVGEDFSFKNLEK